MTIYKSVGVCIHIEAFMHKSLRAYGEKCLCDQGHVPWKIFEWWTRDGASAHDNWDAILVNEQAQGIDLGLPSANVCHVCGASGE